MENPSPRALWLIRWQSLTGSDPIPGPFCWPTRPWLFFLFGRQENARPRKRQTKKQKREREADCKRLMGQTKKVPAAEPTIRAPAHLFDDGICFGTRPCLPHVQRAPLLFSFFRKLFSFFFFPTSLRRAFFRECYKKKREAAGCNCDRWSDAQRWLPRSGLLACRLSVASTSKRRLAIAHPLPRRLIKKKEKTGGHDKNAGEAKRKKKEKKRKGGRPLFRQRHHSLEAPLCGGRYSKEKKKTRRGKKRGAKGKADE